MKVDQSSKKKEPKGADYIPSTAYWRPLIPGEEQVTTPTNPSFPTLAQKPTIDQCDTGKELVKHNYSEQFNILDIRGIW